MTISWLLTAVLAVACYAQCCSLSVWLALPDMFFPPDAFSL